MSHGRETGCYITAQWICDGVQLLRPSVLGVPNRLAGLEMERPLAGQS